MEATKKLKGLPLKSYNRRVLHYQLAFQYLTPSHSEDEARKRWQDWFRLAVSSGLAPVQQFARRLKAYLEGMNNKIKVIKRMAYGYRDNDYFFLKIKAAFPGNVR